VTKAVTPKGEQKTLPGPFGPYTVPDLPPVEMPEVTPAHALAHARLATLRELLQHEVIKKYPDVLKAISEAMRHGAKPATVFIGKDDDALGLVDYEIVLPNVPVSRVRAASEWAAWQRFKAHFSLRGSQVEPVIRRVGRDEPEGEGET
jgi:hypothetical protein